MNGRTRVILLLLSTCLPLALAAQTPPKFRLPAGAAPTHYNVELTVAPDKDGFSGAVDIDINFAQPTSVLWLNAQNLKVKEAWLESKGRRIAAKVIEEPEDFMGFAFESPVGPSAATLHVAYEGQVSRNDMEGIFQRKDGDRWYIYSQFENIAARKAFPCFDEPGFKVPWQLTLHVPREFGAFSNTPALSEANDSPGMKTVRFAETKPLPSYLVAIAVGPFEIVPARDAGQKKTKVRIIVPQGHKEEANFVAGATPDLLELLENYFGIPYPYEKLDEVAVPQAGYAMEHPGLVTYGTGFFLLNPKRPNLSLQRAAASVIAHELAHQWFGDLVTTAWWDDTWLNEGFASWMGDKTLARWKPEWDVPVDVVNTEQEAMRKDELLTSRKVRQPIENNNDITNAFDNITYDKGHALLGMFESYVGEDAFRQRIHTYLVKYSWKNATAADFLNEIAGGDQEIVRAFSSFLDQPGVPQVTAELQCTEKATPSLRLSQQRFLPRGTNGSVDQSWDIPVCVEYSSSSIQRTCTLMKEKTATLTLAGASGCPSWFYGNAAEAGYYRVNYSSDNRGGIVKHGDALSLVERVGFLGNLLAMTRSTIPRGDVLGLMPAFAHSDQWQVVSKTLELTSNLDYYLVPPEMLSQYQRYLSDLYKTRAEQLGMEAKASDNDSDRLLRPGLVDVMATKAQDPEFIEKAKTLATAWLKGEKEADEDTFDMILNAAAEHGDRSFFELLHQAARKERSDMRRYLELYTMGAFREPAVLDSAFKIALSGEFYPHDSLAVFASARDHIWREQQLFQFFQDNWDAIIKWVPVDATGFLPSIGRNFCDADHRSDVEKFFRPRVGKLEGGPRTLETKRWRESASAWATSRRISRA